MGTNQSANRGNMVGVTNSRASQNNRSISHSQFNSNDELIQSRSESMDYQKNIKIQRSSSSIQSTDLVLPHPKHHLREHKRFGVVSVKISSTPNIVVPNRAITPTQSIHHSITPKGAIIYGSMCSPCLIQKGNFTISPSNIKQ
jgi:hypothetical protein